MGNSLPERNMINPSTDDPSQLHDSQKEISVGTINVLSFNMFVRPPFINNNGEDFKDERLAEFLKMTHNYDIIGLQEMFRSYSRRHPNFVQKAKEAGFLFHASSPAIRTFSSYFIDGGLLILSRYPIIHSEFHPYPLGLGVDYYVQKGILYAKIRIGNAILHIFNSHTQANYDDKIKCFIKKTEQLIVFQKYVNDALSRNNYKEEDLVLFMGDLNVDANSKLRVHSQDLVNCPELQNFGLLSKSEEFSEYETLINCLSGNGQEELQDLVFKDHKIHPVTFGEYYVTKKKEKIPLETVLTVKHSICTNQSLDYIFSYVPKTLLNVSEKKESSSQSERLIVMKGSTKVDKFLVKGHNFTQLSDHYGVKVTLQYMKPFEPKKKGKKNVPRH